MKKIMFQKLNEILELKTIKYSLLVVSITGFLLCLLIMLPSIQNFIIKIVEANVLHRELHDVDKWKNYLFSFGLFVLSFFFLTVVYIIVNRQYLSREIVMTNNKINYKKELLYCAAAGIISLLAAFIILGLYIVDLNVPIWYEVDAFGGLTMVQNFYTGNGVFLYPNMGAPGVTSLANSPGVLNIHIFELWILSLFIKEAGLLLNVFFILTFATVSIAATVSLRLLKINLMTSIFGGVLYSFLYYHFYRNIFQLFLSTYTIVPLSCVVILWIINGEIIFNKINFSSKNFLKNITSVFPPKTAFSVFIAVFIGMSNIYFMFFACLGIVFAIVWNLLEERNLKKIIAPSAILLVVVVFAISIQIIPYVIYIQNGNVSGIIGSRSRFDVELYSLKFSQLVLPAYGHRFHFFSKITEYYYNNIYFGPINENYASSLGLLMSAGLIISFFIAMKKSDKIQENISIKHSAVLNIFILLLGSAGGIASLIAFYAWEIGKYNRLSIYIAFFSMYIITYYMDYLSLKFKLRNISKYFIIVFLGILAALDQTGYQRLNNNNLDKYYSDREFVKRIEEITPAGSMVFQLPFVPSHYHANYGAIGPYEQFVPFIHSRLLKWSYRAQIGSPAVKWQEATASKPVEEMLKHLAGVGFKGLYVDKFGYLDEEYNKIRNDIIDITGVQPIVSNNERLEYFYLGEYLENLKKTFLEENIFIYTNWEMPPILMPNQILNVQNNFLGILESGWSFLEDWGVWNVGNSATIEFSILDTDMDLELHATLRGHPNPAIFSAFVNGQKTGNYSIPGNEELQLIIPVSHNFSYREDNLHKVIISFYIENPHRPPTADSRILGIGLINMMLVQPES
jgi:phosphoglycerol transferase